MQIPQQIQILRSHVLRMAMLSHRAVDYSIKAFTIGNPEFGRLAIDSQHEWREVQGLISERGRVLVTAGALVDLESQFARSTLQIYSSLRLTYAAATEIAHNSILMSEGAQSLRSKELRPMGRFVNGLAALYTVALFKMERRHAMTILHDGYHWQRFDMALSLLRASLVRQPGAQARFELAIASSLGQIANQACEIAEAVKMCLDGEGCPEILRKRVA
ncbi:MAG: hypothetical protein ACJ72H_16920 [Candidatus Sulfotelmatobacter sp.]